MAALPGWMAACAAVGAVGAAGLRAFSPSKRQRGDDGEEVVGGGGAPHLIRDYGRDDGVEVGGGGSSVDGRGRKGVERGSMAARWIHRCTKEAITADLNGGCGCPSNCTDHLSVALVMSERTEVAKLDGDERRTELRGYLDANVNASSSLGFNLHPLSDSERRLCANAFDIMRGYGYGYTYKFIRDARNGVGQDSLGAAGGADDERLEEDSIETMGFMGWWKDLRDETEYMPNTSDRELDFIEEKDLYQECRSDLLESGCHESMVGSFSSWKRVWKCHFGDVKIRKHRRVDGKDRKRAFLRYLLRRKVTRNRKERQLIKELRSIYRDTCRRERTYYWVDRIQPAKFPEVYITYISDGATQSDYCLPKIPGFCLGRSVNFKLVGNIWHGHCVHFHLVMPNVKDDSNLVCHCLDTSREVLEEVRAEKGQDRFFPPNMRIQLDGVNTNWGEITFAHIENMHNKRAFGAATNVRRNKVGSTHEDVDQLFAIIKAFLKNKEIMTPQQLVAGIKAAFSTYRLPVFVSIVDATFDYKSHYLAHIDKKLGGYGYSHLTDGYHCLTFDESKSVSSTGVAFKKYQQNHFVDVALQRKDLPPDERPEDDAAFVMCPMIIENDWEPATILLTSPVGKPSVAVGAEKFSWEEALKDVEFFLTESAILESDLVQWREFIDARPKNHEEMKTVASLPKWNFTPRPGGAATQAPESAREIARRAVLASAVRVRAPKNISSSVASGKEGAEDRRKRKDDTDMRRRDRQLENGEFVFYKATYDCCSDESCGGCHIPLLLGQLVGDLSELDTLDPDTRVELKCWEPKDGCYDGDWRKWLDDSRRKQLQVTLEVALIALSGVKFTTKKEKKGGLFQVTAATKTQLRQHRQSNYAKFGAKPVVGKGKKRALPAESDDDDDDDHGDDDDDDPSGDVVACPECAGGGDGGPAPKSPVRR